MSGLFEGLGPPLSFIDTMSPILTWLQGQVPPPINIGLLRTAVSLSEDEGSDAKLYKDAKDATISKDEISAVYFVHHGNSWWG